MKSVFAKVARDRSIIFNYTLNYDFLPAKQYTSVFFLVSQLERGGCSMNITSNTFFFSLNGSKEIVFRLSQRPEALRLLL